jgi:PAS domain S-box-containing protein
MARSLIQGGPRAVFDVVLEVVRAILLSGLLVFLWRSGKNRANLAQHGWSLILSGFGLLLFGSLLDISDNFPSLNRLVVVGDTETEAFLEKLVGYLGGFVILTVGLMKWIPTVSQLTEAISDRRQTEDALRRSEENFRRVMEQAGDGLFIIDPSDGRFVDVNHQACTSLGYRRDELLSLSVPDIDSEFPKDQFSALVSSLKGDETVTIVGTHQRKDGTLFPVEIRIGMVELQGQSRLLALARDVTAQRQAEEQLRQAQRMEAVGQLTGGVAHDFNNLLAIILGNTELLSVKVGEEDPKVQAVIRAATRGSELTQRLLAFSRQQSLRAQATDLEALVSGMSELLIRTLGETIDMQTSAAPGLWDALADPGQVENALLNLALNARDAMPGGGKLTIGCENAHLDEVYLARNPEALAGDYVVLAVSDTGTGMSVEVQSHAFEPFFTTKDVGQGSGLGLSMVHGFAKQSGGHVTMYSQEGQGTTVKLYLPRAEEAVRREEASHDQDAPLGRGEVVLVIEDDPDVRDLAVQTLEGLGYRVSGAPDAARARKLLAEGTQVDLVLSDVVLPGGTSGPEFAEETRTIYPDLKIIFMSGYPAGAAKRYSFLGSDKVLLNKPFKRYQLAKALREVLG